MFEFDHETKKYIGFEKAGFLIGDSRIFSAPSEKIKAHFFEIFLIKKSYFEFEVEISKMLEIKLLCEAL